MAATEVFPPNARVLIVRLSALGDVLFGLETVASLKAERPDLRIDFLVEKRFATILRDHPQLERVVEWPRRGWRNYLPAIRELRQVRYDAVLDLHGILKTALPLLAVRAGARIGYAPPGSREGAHWFYGRSIRLPEPLPHRAERGLALLRELGLSGKAVPVSLPHPDDLDEFWNCDARPRVVLHPGTSEFAAFKRWPAERHGELARRLTDRGIDVGISQGPGEQQLAQQVQAAAPKARILDGTALGLVGLAAVYRHADVVVAADTGPLHIAAAAGTRVVALFGPKDVAMYGPRGREDHEVLFHEVPCRPCKRRDCASPLCVLGLDVDQVEQAVRADLQ